MLLNMEFIWRMRQDFAYFHEFEALNFLFITFCFGFGSCVQYTTWRHNRLLFSQYENIILILSQCENNSLWGYHFYLMDKTRYITFENVINIIILRALLHLLVFHLFSRPQKLFNSSLSVKKVSVSFSMPILYLFEQIKCSSTYAYTGSLITGPWTSYRKFFHIRDWVA